MWRTSWAAFSDGAPASRRITQVTLLPRIQCPAVMRVFQIGVLALATLLIGCQSQAQSPPPPEQQIQAAVQALPEALQAEAQVMGYAAEGSLTTLREGQNELVCLSDTPGDDRFHVACYHTSLGPFMDAGRTLRADGHTGAAVDSIRRARIEAGTLSMPDHPAALYTLTGPAGSFNAETGAVEGASPRYIIYAPFETGETTGLPTQPQGTTPWLMEPGTPWAHIMISTGS